MAPLLLGKETDMSEQRRDNKNRILRMGESQEADGRYKFRYKDANGKQKTIYSWRLVVTDKTPYGKKDNPPLREQEKIIMKDVYKGIAADGGNYTVLTLVEKYISLKTGVKNTTRAGYKTVVNLLNKEAFGNKEIQKVKLSDAKAWLIKLQQEDGKSYSAIHTIRGVLRPAFQMAVDDELITKNPFEFKLASVIVNDSITREAVSKQDEKKFLDFVKNDSHFSRYYEGMYILFKTGMRISEFVGLTLTDLDFEERTINIDHQLQRVGKEIYITSTKTSAGSRVIPMEPDVYECFKRIVENRKTPKVEPMIDGYSGFLYLDKNGNPMLALHWEHYFKHVQQKYNTIYRTPLPKITPHVCRHTYCSNMAKRGVNPKVLQYLMGHSEIGVTLNTYTHVKLDDAKEELAKLAKTMVEEFEDDKPKKKSVSKRGRKPKDTSHIKLA